MRAMTVLFALFIVAVLVAAPVQAQATRTWVSGVGDDANPCSRTAPCKTFAGAISKTAAGGEISVLDPGGFGAVTITKAITINGDGTLAGILAAGTNGVIINAGVNDRIVLRNLSINGAGTGINGIRFLAGKSLTVDQCAISNFTTRGIDVSHTATGDLFVTNTSITNTATAARVGTTGAFFLAMFDHVNVQGNANGIEVAGGGRASVSNSIVSGNTSNGLLVSASGAVINAENSQISFNELVGVNCNVSGGVIRLANNAIYNNTTGISITAGCTVPTAGNNRDFGNSGTTAPNGGAIVVH